MSPPPTKPRPRGLPGCPCTRPDVTSVSSRAVALCVRPAPTCLTRFIPNPAQPVRNCGNPTARRHRSKPAPRRMVRVHRPACRADLARPRFHCERRRQCSGSRSRAPTDCEELWRSADHDGNRDPLPSLVACRHHEVDPPRAESRTATDCFAKSIPNPHRLCVVGETPDTHNRTTAARCACGRAPLAGGVVERVCRASRSVAR